MNLILVGYTPSKTKAALNFCENAFREIKFGHRVLVCNREGVADGEKLKGWTIVSGSNGFAEFSGWQEGLDHLLSVGLRDSVLFVNDTVNTHRRFSEFRRRPLVHELKHAPSRSIVGFTDHSDNDIGDLSIDGLPLSGWLSTYCFLLGEDSLARLQHRLYSTETLERCVPGGTVESEFFSASVSPDLRKHLRRWLFEGGWYRSEPLSESNRDLFTLKARVICAELHLSARCWNMGFARRDPFERHPWSRWADRKFETLMGRIGLSQPSY